MRGLVERFRYRFQLWQTQRYGDYSPADPTARNPLRFVAIAAVISVIVRVAEPFVFHRGFDVVAIIGISVAVLFLALYQSKSRWAWHLVVAWLPFTFALYWILRFSGYARYQPRGRSLAAEIIGDILQLAFFAAALYWFFHVRHRYFRHIEDASAQKT